MSYLFVYMQAAILETAWKLRVKENFKTISKKKVWLFSVFDVQYIIYL